MERASPIKRRNERMKMKRKKNKTVCKLRRKMERKKLNPKREKLLKTLNDVLIVSGRNEIVNKGILLKNKVLSGLFFLCRN